MRVFLISLQHQSPRRNSALEKLRSIGLRFEIIDGVETAKWRPDKLPVDMSHWGRPLQVGEVGCYQAHLRGLERIVDYRIPWACILEDDFCLEADPAFGLHELDAHLPKDFHYIHLQRDLEINPNYRILSRCDPFYRTKQTPLGALGYVITRPLAEHILKHHSICKMPIDHLYCHLSERGNFYSLIKPIVGCQLGLTSDMDRTICQTRVDS